MRRFTAVLLFVGMIITTETSLASRHLLSADERTLLNNLMAAASKGILPMGNSSQRVIENAIIDGDLSGAEGEFVPAIVFCNCDFEGKIDFRHATFRKSITFDRCTFERECDFSKATFVDAAFAGSEFKHGVNLRSVHVSGDLSLADTQFTTAAPGFGLDLRGAEVGGSLSVRLARCHGPADLSYTRISVNLDVTGSRFDYRTDANVGFDLGYAKIGHDQPPS